MEAAFEAESVPSDMNIRCPTSKLTIKFGDKEVNPGDVVTPTQMQHPPLLSWAVEDKAYYTLVMNDPDAPSRAEPKFREWHHWLVANIPGSKVNKGETMSEYIGAGPPKGTGLHRYVFLVFKQKEGKKIFPGVSKLTNHSPANRKSCKVAEFAAQHELGDPVAGNFVQAEWDDYCPKLYKQLSMTK